MKEIDTIKQKGSIGIHSYVPSKLNKERNGRYSQIETITYYKYFTNG